MENKMKRLILCCSYNVECSEELFNTTRVCRPSLLSKAAVMHTRNVLNAPIAFAVDSVGLTSNGLIAKNSFVRVEQSASRRFRIQAALAILTTFPHSHLLRAGGKQIEYVLQLQSWMYRWIIIQHKCGWQMRLSCERKTYWTHPSVVGDSVRLVFTFFFSSFNSFFLRLLIVFHRQKSNAWWGISILVRASLRLNTDLKLDYIERKFVFIFVYACRYYFVILWFNWGWNEKKKLYLIDFVKD